mgnify:CR=1 FL=1
MYPSGYAEIVVPYMYGNVRCHMLPYVALYVWQRMLPYVALCCHTLPYVAIRPRAHVGACVRARRNTARKFSNTFFYASRVEEFLKTFFSVQVWTQTPEDTHNVSSSFYYRQFFRVRGLGFRTPMNQGLQCNACTVACSVYPIGYMRCIARHCILHATRKPLQSLRIPVWVA